MSLGGTIPQDAIYTSDYSKTKAADFRSADINKDKRSDKVGHRTAVDVISRKWSRVERHTDRQTQEENPSLCTRNTAAPTQTLKLTHRENQSAQERGRDVFTLGINITSSGRPQSIFHK